MSKLNIHRVEAIGFYSDYCQHESKWESNPSPEQVAERQALLDAANAKWAKHLSVFKIGQRVKVDSGMGGVFEGKCTKIDNERIFIKVDNKQSDWHGKTASACYKQSRVSEW